jgi:hypothetical protein
MAEEGWRELWSRALQGPQGAELRALVGSLGLDADDPEGAVAALTARWPALLALDAPDASARVGAWLAEVQPTLRALGDPEPLGGGTLHDALSEAGVALRDGAAGDDGVDLQATADALAARFGEAQDMADAAWRGEIAAHAARDVQTPELGPLCPPGAVPPLAELDLDALLAGLTSP